MSTDHKWTSSDDDALARQIDAEQYARQHVYPILAELFDLPVEEIEAAATIRVVTLPPCTHWRCQWRRLTTRITTALTRRSRP